ncbi:F0F1 ATP synthase subunit epsilon [Zobellia laminariae]|uniref:F0F1 ATP synthase subunit epsilon n=1 Tax=Zobellia laminariae TaxID=248906 RepID=UPI0012D93217|nr:F0F1 ATP synthase subunit epsilon [Zobellia laminariae]MUH42097.1 F0F1 ATP synthase subunit epsilon [Zobellia laminariae]WKX77720.1 F0F1 ATP synthase subunit epsilon [Zobellia laminariae]
MYLEIVSPEATLFSGEVTSVTVPGVNGEFQILNGHAAIVSLLQKGNVRVDGNITIEGAYASKFSKDASGKVTLPIASGTVEMSDNRVIILAD